MLILMVFYMKRMFGIRDKPIRFLKHHERGGERGNTVLEWGDLEKKLGDFTLKTSQGSIHRSEVVGVVGPNATGKSTMIKILAGKWIMMGMGHQRGLNFV